MILILLVTASHAMWVVVVAATETAMMDATAIAIIGIVLMGAMTVTAAIIETAVIVIAAAPVRGAATAEVLEEQEE
ncbi:hypothetical protein BGZ98_009548 [Dissophora globulifera]|nr:hypothetical protein BGZ98_009548 [Dissophora globulifera]